MGKKQTARATTRGRAASAAKGAKILRRARKAPAIFTQDQMHSLEAKVEEDRDGITRRLALAVLAQPGAKFLDDVTRDRGYAVAIADTSKCLTGYVGRLRELIELMESAQARMLVALANRKDMDSVIQEARGTDAQEARPLLRLVVDNTQS